MKRFLLAVTFVVATLFGTTSFSDEPAKPEVKGGDVCVLCPKNDNVNLAEHLQNISVMVGTTNGSGSGVIITRNVKVGDKEETINFIWTAAHVIEALRNTRTTIVNGQPSQIIEFKDPYIVKELVESGRRVGELRMECTVIKYSDANNGEDLALLMVRKRNFIQDSATFYLDGDMIVKPGTALVHVGSLKGQIGANSFTTGVLSQVGRVLNLGNSNVVFDQSTVTAFPGSSGGGVFLSDNGKYIGMLVRGSGEQFNFIVPIRRMKSFCEKNNMLWSIDESQKMPTLEEILSINVEGDAVAKKQPLTEDAKNFPTILQYKD